MSGPTHEKLTAHVPLGGTLIDTGERAGMRVTGTLTFTAPDGTTQSITFALTNADYRILAERVFDEEIRFHPEIAIPRPGTDYFGIALTGQMTTLDPDGTTLRIETTTKEATQ